MSIPKELRVLKTNFVSADGPSMRIKFKTLGFTAEPSRTPKIADK